MFFFNNMMNKIMVKIKKSKILFNMINIIVDELGISELNVGKLEYRLIGFLVT